MALLSAVDPFARCARTARSSSAWSEVSGWSTLTESAKPTTAPRSPARRVFRKPDAASCTVSILSPMLELVSMSTIKSTATALASKNCTSCFTPSS